MYRLIDTDTRKVIATGESEAAVLASTPFLPADCVPDAASWEEVVEVARQHADGIPGVVEGYAVERINPAAVELGRRGGLVRGGEKAEAVRRNGAQGGRPSDWTDEENALALLPLDSRTIAKRIKEEFGKDRTPGAVLKQRSTLRRRGR